MVNEPFSAISLSVHKNATRDARIYLLTLIGDITLMAVEVADVGWQATLSLR